MFKLASVPVSPRDSTQLLAPLGVLVACGALLGIEMRRPASMLATTSTLPDLDIDGLPDSQERVIGTSPGLVDSDRDQYTDTEEFARGSSPIFQTSVPNSNVRHLAMSAHGEADGLHALIGVYLPDSDFRAVDLRVGMVSGTRIAYLPETLIESRATLEFVGADRPEAAVAVVDFRFARSLVDRTGHLTMFATLARKGSGIVESVSVIELFNVGGVIVLAMPDPFSMPALAMRGGAAAGSGGTIYKPLTPGGDDTPRGWTMEEVCFQESQPVGVSGSIVTNEVISAECRSGWDGSCPSTCSASVGSTYTTIDPASLIGG